MGTAQVAFAVERCGAATGSLVTGSHMTGSDSRDRKWHQSLSGSMFCACATGSCDISALMGPFWPEVTSVTWPEEALSLLVATIYQGNP